MTQIIPSKWWWGGWWSWATYTAWTWIDISAQNEISIDTDVVQTVGNMVDNLTWADDDHYPTAKAVADAISWGWLWDVIWPASSTDWDVVLFDWATWKLIKDSWVLLSSKLDASALSDNNYWWAWENDSTHTPTKRVLYDKIHTMDVEIWNKAADNTVVKLSWNQTINWTKTFGTSPVVPSKTSSATNTWTSIATEAQVYSVKTAVDTINWKIPSAATSSNKLADKAYVDDSINSVTAYYITKNAQGDQWDTYSELADAKFFYSWWELREPTRNDYTIVLDDETHGNATTRYIFNKGWEYQYTVNETAMTQAQLDALNSWITSAKVATYDGYASSKQDVSNLKTSLSDNSDTYYPSQKAVKTAVDKKQDTLVAWTDISIANPIVPEWYTQLTYLGADWQINLWFRTTNNSRIETSWTKNKNANKFLYQSDSGSTLTTNTTAYSTTWNANWRFGNRYISIDTSALKDYLTIQDSSGVTVNGTTYAYSTVNTFSSTNYFRILYTWDEDIIRIKYLKHYSSDVLTLHIVPAMRNSDNAYGFYDVVSDTFFTDDTLTYDVGEVVHPEISFNNESWYALDNEVVHLSWTETISWAKTFTSWVEVQVNSDAWLNIKSNSAWWYLYVTRWSGGSQVQSEIKSVSSWWAFGTATSHPLMLRTNDTTQVTIGTDGSVVLETDVAANSNNNQVATTKWVNSKYSTITVTLAAASWSSQSITVSATWVTATNTVIISPVPASMTDYTNGWIKCVTQWADSLTFECSTTPTNDIDVNVVILN